MGRPGDRTPAVSDLAYNEQAKLLATGLNNIAVAFIVIGVVKPITAVGFGMPSAPAISIWAATLGRHLVLRRSRLTSVGTTRLAEPQTVNAGQIFVTFVIPAFVLLAAYLAVLAHERAGRRLDRKPPGE